MIPRSIQIELGRVVILHVSLHLVITITDSVVVIRSPVLVAAERGFAFLP